MFKYPENRPMEGGCDPTVSDTKFNFIPLFAVLCFTLMSTVLDIPTSKAPQLHFLQRISLRHLVAWGR